MQLLNKKLLRENWKVGFIYFLVLNLLGVLVTALIIFFYLMATKIASIQFDPNNNIYGFILLIVSNVLTTILSAFLMNKKFIITNKDYIIQFALILNFLLGLLFIFKSFILTNTVTYIENSFIREIFYLAIELLLFYFLSKK